MANEFIARNGIVAQNNSVFTGSLTVTQAITAQSLTGSMSGTASYASNALTSSYSLVSTSGSYAATSSYANSFTVANTLTAQTLVVQTITSSVDFVTGSTIFGSTTDNTHQFTGSVLISGSGYINGSFGIGSTSPSGKLEVNLGALSAYFTRVAGDNGTTNPALQIGTSTSSPRLYAYGLGMEFFTAAVGGTGTLKMILNSSGNLGIGTSSPSTKLALAGSTATTFGLSLEPSGWNSARHRLNVPTSGDNSMWSFNWDGSAVDSALYAVAAINVTQGVITFSTTGSANAPTERMRVNGAGYVGIGTSAPSTNLHISASATATLRLQGASSTGFDIQNDNTGGYLWNRDNTVIYFGTNNTERMRITSGGQILMGTTTAQSGTRLQVGGILDVWSSTNTLLRLRHDGTRGIIETFTGGAYGATSIAPDGGNVGIGTTSPNEKLDVSGNISITTYTGTKIGFNTNDSFTAFGASTAHYGISYPFTANPLSLSGYFGLAFFTNGTERMRITGDGNVGIGTTSPTLSLHIATSGGDLSSTVTYASSTKGIVLTQDSGNSNYGNGLWFYNNSIPSGIASTRENATNWGTDLRFYTHQTATTNQNVLLERMRIDSSGNVGIGTTSPQDTLDVSSQGGIRASRPTTSQYVQLYYAGLQGSSLNDMYFTGGTGYGLIFNTNGSSERMRITSGGNVGIGTSSPSYKLHVVSSNYQLQVEPTSAVSMALLKPAAATGGVNAFTVGVELSSLNTANFRYTYNGYGSSSNYVGIGFWANDDILNVVGTGRVGIGTTSPGKKLDVSASDENVLRLQRTGASARQWDINIKPNFTIGDNTAAADRFTIDTSGNVGIGTTSPNTRLKVIGGSSTFQFALKLAKDSYADTGGHTTLIGLGCEDAAWSRSAIGHTRTTSYDAGYLGFYVSNNTSTGDEMTSSDLRMMINRDGKVGIGTNSPGASLHIVGDNKTTGYSYTDTLEFTAWFQSGTHTIATLSNYSTDTVAVVTLEWALLYAYAGTTHAQGIKMASTRRSNNNTIWTDLDNTNVSIVGDTSYQPNLYWDAGVLKMDVNSSVQITARVRLTVHSATVTRDYSAS